MLLSKTEQAIFDDIFNQVIKIADIPNKKKFRNTVEKFLETNSEIALKTRFINAFHTAMRNDMVDLSSHEAEVEKLISDKFLEHKPAMESLSQFIKQKRLKKRLTHDETAVESGSLPDSLHKTSQAANLNQVDSSKKTKADEPLKPLYPAKVQASITPIFSLLNKPENESPAPKRRKYN